MLCRSVLNIGSNGKTVLIGSLNFMNYIGHLSVADIHTSMTKKSEPVRHVPCQIIDRISVCRYISHHTTAKNRVCCHRSRLSELLSPGSLLRTDCRGYKGKKKKGREEESSSDSESESDEDEALKDVADDGDDLDAPAEYKQMKLHVKSLRIDNIISGGLDIARNRVDELFFANRLRLNGDKLSKKSKQMSEGDYVDVITEKLEDVFKVKRVKIVQISLEKTSKDKHIVHTKVWKQPFEILNINNKEW